MPSFSVNNLKSTIEVHGGLAKQNRYMIALPNIAFGTTRPSAFFDRTENRTNEIFSMFCKSANMPGKQLLSVDRRVGLTYNKIAYGYASDDVVLSFILTENYFLKDYFEAWQQYSVISTGEGAHYPRYQSEYAKDISVTQLGLDGESKHTIKLLKAYPTTVNPIQFNDATGEPTELNVQISYKRWIKE